MRWKKKKQGMRQRCRNLQIIGKVGRKKGTHNQIKGEAQAPNVLPNSTK
jgi:hypothetical protein